MKKLFSVGIVALVAVMSVVLIGCSGTASAGGIDITKDDGSKIGIDFISTVLDADYVDCNGVRHVPVYEYEIENAYGSWIQPYIWYTTKKYNIGDTFGSIVLPGDPAWMLSPRAKVLDIKRMIKIKVEISGLLVKFTYPVINGGEIPPDNNTESNILAFVSVTTSLSNVFIEER